MLDEARTFATEFLKDQMKPASLRKTLTHEVMAMLPILRRLPRRLDKIAATLERGSLTTNTRLFATSIKSV